MTWIQTFTGEKFDLLDPQPSTIRIEDIAHALSNICRYTGHSRFFYSVASHSVMVADLVPEQHMLWGLLHDAAEAYVADISSPLKQLLPRYRVIENNILAAIMERFSLERFSLVNSMPPEVKMMDMVMLATEPIHLFGTPPEPWAASFIEPLDVEIMPMNPHDAEELFLLRFGELYHGD